MHIETRILRGTVVALALLVLSVAAASPAAAQYYDRDNTLRFRGGLFEPDGDSEYWNDAETLFTGDASELEDFLAGFDYERALGGGGRLSLLLSASAFGGEDDREDLFFEDNFGNPIVHTATLDVASFTAGLKLDLLPRGRIRPYVGAGGGYYLWDLEERGDFVFSGPEFDEIFFETFQDDGATLGYYFLGGIAVPFNESWGVFAEGRWHRAEDELGGDFEDFGDLDLSGREISAGVSWTF